jgi:hypothetical protein
MGRYFQLIIVLIITGALLTVLAEQRHQQDEISSLIELNTAISNDLNTGQRELLAERDFLKVAQKEYVQSVIGAIDRGVSAGQISTAHIEAWSVALGAMQLVIENENSWPKSDKEMEALYADLSNIVSDMPSWAEDALIVKLNAVRWGLSSLSLINQSTHTNTDILGDYADAIETAIAAKPASGSNLILSRLKSLSPVARSKFDEHRRHLALADIKSLIADKNAREGDFAEPLARLSEWSKQDESQEGKLERAVRVLITTRNTQDFIESTRDGLAKADSEENSTIRQIYYGRLLDSIITQKQLILEDAAIDPKLVTEIDGLAVEVQKQLSQTNKAEVILQNERYLNYQSSSLQQIRKFNESFETRVTGPNDSLGIKADVIQYLIPISTQYLDSAVSRLYQASFNKAWDALDDDEQLAVAEAEVTTQKTTPVRQ